MKLLTVVLILSLQSTMLYARVYVPENETMPLVKVSQSKQLQLVRSMREQLKEQPGKLELVSEIIKQYMQLGREQADERYFSYAETLLKPYLDSKNTNVTLLIQWADILQRQHRFEEAKVVLGQVLQIDKQNAHAHLMRSVIYQAQGDLVSAMSDCQSLLGRAEALVATTCLAQVSALRGQLSQGIKLLEITLERYQGQYTNKTDVIDWSRTVMAEMLVRAGKPEQALASLYKINNLSTDFYALAVISDLLIQQQRYEEVVKLTEDKKHVTKLLLRYVIAVNHLGMAKTSDVSRLKLVMKSSEKLAENPHKRMLARYYLDVENNPVQASKVAKHNWQEQKEPDDALILVRSMKSANDKHGIEAFINNHHKVSQQDARIDSILGQVDI